jgi:hypothetical protein
MVPKGRGTWAAVSWPYQSNNTGTQRGTSNYHGALELCYNREYNRTRSNDYIEATYQLNLEFEEPKFAKGERQVLAHLSKLLDTQSMADVTFVVRNEKIGAHSAIISFKLQFSSTG